MKLPNKMCSGAAGRTVLIIALMITLAVAAALFFSELGSRDDWKVEAGAYREGRETLIVAADKDYVPYSFKDEDGNPSGHDIELIYALAERMNVNIEIRLYSSEEALLSLTEGETDILLGVTFSKTRMETMLFSMPVTSEVYIAFGKRDKDFSTIDLFGRRVSTIAGDSVYNEFVVPFGLDKDVSLYPSYSDAFKALDGGKCDYVIAPYMTGERLINNSGYRNIEPLGSELYNSNFCIALKKDNNVLRERINVALSELSRDGVLSKINDRWLESYINGNAVRYFFRSNRDILTICVMAIMLLLVMLYVFLDNRAKRKLFYQSERARIYEETSGDPLFEYNIQTDTFDFLYKDSSNYMHRTKHMGYIADKEYEKVIDPEYRERFVALLRGKGYGNGNEMLECLGRFFDSNESQWYRLSLSTVCTHTGGAPISIVGCVKNINKEKLEHEEALRLATTDALTGINNRKAFTEKTESSLRNESCSPYAFIMLDIDNFKTINDTYGHSTGDSALVHVANTMSRVFAAEDTIGRFGGDEFLIFMPKVDSPVLCRRIEQLRSLLLTKTDKLPLVMTCSIGVVYSSDTSHTVDELVAKADEAMYTVKHEDKNSYLIVEG